MSEWQEYTLGDIVDIKHGYAFKGEFFSETPTTDILVTPGNFKIGGGFKSDKLKYYNGEIPDGFVLSHEDIIVTMTDLSKQADTLGYSAKVPIDSSKVFLHNQRIGLLIFKDKSFDKDFIYWLMRAEHYQKFVAGSATGATVKHSSPSRIRAFRFKAPTSNSLRKKIAKILSNYDDLIENNLKRIKLLEESARLTYEEWFLRFRIDGKKLDIDPDTGLPFGWEKVKLKSFCILTMGQSPKSKFYNQTCEGLPFHQGVTNYGFRFPSNTTWSTEGSRISEEGDILFSVRAPVGRLNVSIEKIILGRGLASIRQINDLNSFLFYQLQNIFFEDNLMGSGAIFDSVTKRDVEDIELIYSKNISEKFNTLTSTIDNEIKNLTNQNKFLKEARDILLPRLMTGMIDTNDMSIAV